jgi:hypothetical protein
MRVVEEAGYKTPPLDRNRTRRPIRTKAKQDVVHPTPRISDAIDLAKHNLERGG